MESSSWRPGIPVLKVCCNGDTQKTSFSDELEKNPEK